MASGHKALIVVQEVHAMQAFPLELSPDAVAKALASLAYKQ